MDPFQQELMNIRPLVIQPIDSQDNSPDVITPQTVASSLENVVGHSVHTQVATNYVAQQNAPSVGQMQEQGSHSLQTTESVYSIGLLNHQNAIEYSWQTFDGQTVPAITPEKLIPVKIIEQKILSYFPNTFPLIVRNRPPLRSIPMKLCEMNLMNSLNKRYKLGFGEFKERDVMVRMDDFNEFYAAIKMYYPQCVKDLISGSSGGSDSSKSRLGDTFGSGWIQINNTVLPYVKHGGNAFLPVDVILNAAKLPVEQEMTAILPLRLYETLNEMCTILKRNIVFNCKTEMLPLHVLEKSAKGLIKFIQYLPSSDPKKYAKYMPDLDETTVQGTTKDQESEKVDIKPICENNSISQHIGSSSNELSTNTTPEDKAENMHSSETLNKEQTTGISCRDETEAVKIDTISCEGKDLQCLHRKEGKFVLMEALLRVFFPDLTLEHFSFGVEVVLGTDIPECTPEEEKAFINVYRIPSPSLKSRKLIATLDLEKNLPILRRMFELQFQQSITRKGEQVGDKKTEGDVICLD